MKEKLCPICGKHKQMIYVRPKIDLDPFDMVLYDEHYLFCADLAMKGEQAEFIPEDLKKKNDLAIQIARSNNKATTTYLISTNISAICYDKKITQDDLTEMRQYGLSNIESEQFLNYPAKVHAEFNVEVNAKSPQEAYNLAIAMYEVINFDEIFQSIIRSNFTIINSCTI